MKISHITPLNLLVSLKDEDDIACLMSYVRNFIQDRSRTKVILLHVMRSAYRKSDMRSLSQVASADDETRATKIIKDASQYLHKYNIAFDTCIRQGEVSTEILDAAEMFDCKAIILRKTAARPWARLFAHNVANRVIKANRDVPVILVGTDGFSKEWRQQHRLSTPLLTPGWLR